MIELDIQDYCQSCPEFEAKVEQSNIYANGTPYEMLTCIRCEHQSKCRNIKQHLEKKLKGEFVL